MATNRKKRPDGEGSISRRKDGRYERRYTVRTPDGPKRKTVHGSTRVEVAGKLAIGNVARAKARSVSFPLMRPGRDR